MNGVGGPLENFPLSFSGRWSPYLFRWSAKDFLVNYKMLAELHLHFTTHEAFASLSGKHMCGIASFINKTYLTLQLHLNRLMSSSAQFECTSVVVYS